VSLSKRSKGRWARNPQEKETEKENVEKKRIK